MELNNNLIFGKDITEGVTGCEVDENYLILFIRDKDGKERKEFKKHQYYILTPEKIYNSSIRLQGDLHYKFLTAFDDRNKYYSIRKSHNDCFSIFDQKESSMIVKGITQYKGMKIEDIPVLSFDIETTTLEHTDDAKILIISNTFSYKGKRKRKLFAYDEYASEKEMLEDWCKWVKEINPDVLTLHNGYMFDLPYLDFIAKRCGATLNIGKDGSALKIDSYKSKFRRDGSQFYEYDRAHVFGRNIIDTFFLSIKYDIGRKYENYKLKYIVNHEGLEVKGRQFYDADQIRHKYKDKEEFEKIKEYAKYDADDCLNLFYLMAAPYFYLTQSVPMTFENMINRATGSQVNSVLVRSYLQDKHSIPKANEKEEFEGAISNGYPGVYRNCWKVDFASLYPSIILQYNVCNEEKDPNKHLLKITEYFYNERLNNKKLAQERDDKYYLNLSESQKIFLNSIYGFMGAPGLSFNSPKHAAFITEKGREFLTQSVEWTKQKEFQLVNLDTDSIMICNNDKPFTKEVRASLLEEVNKLFPKYIKFADDGYYKCVLVLKAKNYVLEDEKKRKTKGSALKATTKEKALREFIDEVVDVLMARKKEHIFFIYNKYVKEIFNLTDIGRWASKKTYTDKIDSSDRANETKIKTAIEGSEYKISDKLYVYFDKFDNLKLKENWQHDHSEERLLGKLYSTLNIFKTVIDIDCYPDLTLERNKNLLPEILK